MAVLSVDFDSARKEMVEDQIRRRGIRDRAVLQALLRVPRHLLTGGGVLGGGPAKQPCHGCRDA